MTFRRRCKPRACDSANLSRTALKSSSQTFGARFIDQTTANEVRSLASPHGPVPFALFSTAARSVPALSRGYGAYQHSLPPYVGTVTSATAAFPSFHFAKPVSRFGCAFCIRSFSETAFSNCTHPLAQAPRFHLCEPSCMRRRI